MNKIDDKSIILLINPLLKNGMYQQNIGNINKKMALIVDKFLILVDIFFYLVMIFYFGDKSILFFMFLVDGIFI